MTSRAAAAAVNPDPSGGRLNATGGGGGGGGEFSGGTCGKRDDTRFKAAAVHPRENHRNFLRFLFGDSHFFNEVRSRTPGGTSGVKGRESIVFILSDRREIDRKQT